MPTFVIVAGPNGSGKSTISASKMLEGFAVIDPDAIARTINPIEPNRAAVPAARKAVRQCWALLTAGESFVLESTLSGHGALSLMRLAKRREYQTLLIFIALGDPELQIERVRLRVAQGGHDIPDEVIRRRYWRSLSHAPEAIRLADESLILNNAGPQPEPMFIVVGGRVTWRAGLLPSWVQQLIAELE